MNIISFIAYYFYLILNLNASNLSESKHTNNWAVIVKSIFTIYIYNIKLLYRSVHLDTGSTTDIWQML
jgi:glycosylphosphatidylinositol transamidase (GPIT) subunit GPI8